MNTLVFSIRVYYKKGTYTVICCLLSPCYQASNYFPEIFVDVMLCDRHVYPRHAPELKFTFQWIR